jgi:CheY-like chemotaxis protein
MTLDSFKLLQASDRQHLMLLYKDEGIRNATEIDCINEALKLGQFCVFASVDVQDRDFMSRFSARINDYDKHLKVGNLLVVNFMPFYSSAAKADLTLFKKLKEQIEVSIKERIASGNSGKALVVADAACNLTKHRQFVECVSLETWWQETYLEWAKNNLDITIICAHPSTILEQNHFIQKSNISHVHSLTIDLEEFSNPQARNETLVHRPPEARPLRILVAEPEPDIQALYKRHFQSLPVETVLVENGKECLEQALILGDFDVVIIDTHLNDLGGIEIAKKILEEKPTQNIVLTTTHDPDSIQAHLKSESLDANAADVLVKPFRFSQLLSVINPAQLGAK